jgi:hypothetical protein
MSEKNCTFAAESCKDMKEQRFITIFDSIRECGFSVHTLELIDNYTNDILNGRTNLDRFNQQEHAGLCLADSPLIGAYAVCGYARASLESGSYASASQGSPTNWEIDGKQEECVEQWARAKGIFFVSSLRSHISIANDLLPRQRLTRW